MAKTTTMRTIPLLLAALLSGSLFAQPYAPLLGSSKIWDVYYLTGTPNGYGSAERYHMEGDTSIDNQQYQRLWKRAFVPMNPWPFVPPFSLADPRLDGLLREDTLLRQVFYRPLLPDGFSFGAETVLYDFSLSPGDSMVIYPDRRFVLDSIGITTIENGEQRRIFYFGPITGFNCASYIEGIGGSADLTLSLDCLFEAGPTMGCVKENGIPLWSNPFFLLGESACDVALTTRNLKPAELQAYPNPATGMIRVELAGMDYTYLRLYNSSGRLCREQSMRTPTEVLELSLENLTPGIYSGFLSGQSGLATFRVQKIKPND